MRISTAGDDEGVQVTEWVPVNNGEVTFVLPDDLLDGQEAPWEEENNSYVRVRQAGEEMFPAFDMVSSPFTLEMKDDRVLFSADTFNVQVEAETGTEISFEIVDRGSPFGSSPAWEAAIYSSESMNGDTEGRLTRWTEAGDGGVTFILPDDLEEGQSVPWGEQVFIRLRSLDGEYSMFDVAARPFLLREGHQVASQMVIYRGIVQSMGSVNLYSLGIDFGESSQWEAALYLTGEEG